MGIFSRALATDCRNENSSLWYGSRSETGPTAGDLVRVGAAPLEELDEVVVTLDADALTPRARMLDFRSLEPAPLRRLDEPRRLRQRADLVCEEPGIVHAAASAVAVL